MRRTLSIFFALASLAIVGFAQGQIIDTTPVAKTPITAPATDPAP